jgi:hypothetical protein
MKVYRVITERDGATCQAPGVSSTEIIKEDFYVAASDMETVWDHTGWLRGDESRTMISITEVIPAISILK